MRVAAHGNVDSFCEAHGMTIVERYVGDVGVYNGSCQILVTDNCSDLNDFYYLKHKLMYRNVILVSTHWSNEAIELFVDYMHKREKDRSKGNRAGRAAFGFRWDNGKWVEDPATIGVARRIVALRDAGKTYRQIADDPGVHYSDGRKMSLSTIQVILRNRSKYE